jgi:4-hydroxybenzoate polyprenyltransferase
MTALQASIGALNDLVDAPADAGHKPGKPIPSGLIRSGQARIVVLIAATLGVVLAIPSGLPTIVLALAVLGIGYTYDLAAKGTAWSWLPFAVGIPILPVFGWVGAGAGLPGWFAILVPMASIAGAALAVANARPDLERDVATGTRTVATALGDHRAWIVSTVLWSVVGMIAVVSAVGAGTGAVADPIGGPAVARWVALVAGLGALGVGVVIGRGGEPTRRQRAWEIQAIGAGVTGIAWVAIVTA